MTIAVILVVEVLVVVVVVVVLVVDVVVVAQMSADVITVNMTQYSVDWTSSLDQKEKDY
jgi:hypothetical protein